MINHDEPATMKYARKWYLLAVKEKTTGGRSFRAFARDMFAPLHCTGKLRTIVEGR